MVAGIRDDGGKDRTGATIRVWLWMSNYHFSCTNRRTGDFGEGTT